MKVFITGWLGATIRRFVLAVVTCSVIGLWLSLTTVGFSKLQEETKEGCKPEVSDGRDNRRKSN